MISEKKPSVAEFLCGLHREHGQVAAKTGVYKHGYRVKRKQKEVRLEESRRTILQGWGTLSVDSKLDALLTLAYKRVLDSDRVDEVY